MVKDWKDFEHEVYLKLKGYEDNNCFKLIPKPVLTHTFDKAEYRLPEFLIISDENNLIILVDCKKNYWKNIDLDSLNRLGWAIRGFLEKKSDFGLVKSSNIYFPQKRPASLSKDEYILNPVLLCTGAEFEYKKDIMYLPDTEEGIQYTILNFKNIDKFISLHFPIPSSSSSIETIKKRADKGELSSKDYSRILKILKEAGPKHYLTDFEIKDKIILDSEIELLLSYICFRSAISPFELEEYGKSYFDEDVPVGVTIESYEEDSKVFLPLGTNKTTDLVLILLSKKFISIDESNILVWMIDGGIIVQPPGSKFMGKSIEGKVIPFVFNITEKGKKILYMVHGSSKKFKDTCYERFMKIGS